MGVLGGLIILSVQLFSGGPKQQQESQTKTTTTSTTTTKKEETPKAKTTLKTSTGQEFEDLYNSFAYPNTNEIIEQPSITGNPEADLRIRDIALARGYRLRSNPKSPMPNYEEFTFQQLALNDFNRLKKAALDAGMGLGISAAFRSPEDQREIFIGRMRAAGISAEQIAAGTQGAAVSSLLATTAVPGYSRHHTGYTLDLACGGWDVFAYSPCFRWLNANNYEQAKIHGWIPSYPDGAVNQGPDPEPWEYVWVGTDVLYQ